MLLDLISNAVIPPTTGFQRARAWIGMVLRRARARTRAGG